MGTTLYYVSDVWQGPGWWLASDGKWYPEDAKSGAVYEGDLGEVVDSSTPTAAEPVIAEPVVSAPVAPQAAVAEPVVVEPVVAEPVVVEPVVTEPVVVEPVAVEPVAAEPDVGELPSEAESPFATEPLTTEPVVPAATQGGWQTIEEMGAQIEEDRWTKTPDSSELPEVVPDVLAPEVDMPAVPEAATAVPEIDWSDGSIEDVAAPEAEIPEFPMPEPVIDSAGIDSAGIDSVEMPAADIPEVAAADAIVPDITMPSSDVPSSDVPSSDVPDMEIPDISVAEAETAQLGGPLSTDAEPIERLDAWRSPAEPEPTTGSPAFGNSATTTRPPEVVDLTPVTTKTYDIPQTDEPNLSLIGGIVGAIVLVGGIIWLAAALFSGGDSTEDTATDGQADTEVVDGETEEGATDGQADTEEGADDGPNIISVFAMRQGDCIVGDISGQLTEVEKVDCDQEHDFQVYREALVDNSITEFDEVAITTFAENLCRATLVETVPADDERGISFKILQPTVDSWNEPGNPDRLVTCLLFDEDAPLIGRVG